jgi:molybdopterin converting factor small subunit
VPQVTVRYYSRLKDFANCTSERLQMDAGATLRDVVTASVCRHPALVSMAPTFLLARNAEFAGPDDAVFENDVIDLMPPVSGG